MSSPTESSALFFGEEAAPAEASRPQIAELQFTGSGAEYFRIWVVNAALTLATLGIYSAWAKVRKADYFARNTRLLGDPFHFRANPWAILRGRVIALGLVAFYSLAFDFSRNAGLVATALLVGTGPWLFMMATRFRLRSTRWRGLRFELDVSVRKAYSAVLLVVVVWVSGTVLLAFANAELQWLVLVALAPGLLWPWMHHRLKAFQHGHVRFGEHRSQFRPAVGRFYAVYAIGSLFLPAVGIVAAIVFMMFGGRGPDWLAGAVVGVAFYLAAWPYFAARLQFIVWRQTELGPVRFATRITYRGAWKVLAKNAVGLVATAGLYWPFAAVAWARYRIECMQAISDVPLDDLTARTVPAATPATGEGALDLLGIDLGW